MSGSLRADARLRGWTARLRRGRSGLRSAPQRSAERYEELARRRILGLEAAQRTIAEVSLRTLRSF